MEWKEMDVRILFKLPEEGMMFGDSTSPLVVHAMCLEY